MDLHSLCEFSLHHTALKHYYETGENKVALKQKTSEHSFELNIKILNDKFTKPIFKIDGFIINNSY